MSNQTPESYRTYAERVPSPLVVGGTRVPLSVRELAEELGEDPHRVLALAEQLATQERPEAVVVQQPQEDTRPPLPSQVFLSDAAADTIRQQLGD